MSLSHTVGKAIGDLWDAVNADDVSASAATLAYHFLLALFPFAIFLTAIAGPVAKLLGAENPALEVLDRLGGGLPTDVRSLLEAELKRLLETQQPGLVSIGIAGAIWAASNAIGATMKAMNRAYRVEETRAYWKRTLLAIGLTILTGGFLVGVFVIATIGQALGSRIAGALGLRGAYAAAMLIGPFVFAVMLLLLAVAFLYWAAPNVKLPFRWLTPGSVLFVAAWIAGSFGFGLYVSHFGTYNATYGTLGGVVVLMVWLYLTAFMLLVGAELNANLARGVDADAPDGPASAATLAGLSAGPAFTSPIGVTRH